jgi:regulator of protease activity HflC (stomatin/prohibitin superfamily)
MFLPLLGFCLLALLLAVIGSRKSVAANECIVLLKDGKPERAISSGAVLILPNRKYLRLDMRFTVLPLPPMTMGIYGSLPVVSGQFSYQILDPLKAAAVDDLPKRLTRAMEEALNYLLDQSTIDRCLHERDLWEMEIADSVNRRAKNWGVKVSSVSVYDLPVHRQIMRNIMDCLTSTPAALIRTTGSAE